MLVHYMHSHMLDNKKAMHVKNKIRRTTTSFDFESTSSKESPQPAVKLREPKYIRKTNPTNENVTNGQASNGSALNGNISNRRHSVFTETIQSQPSQVHGNKFSRPKSTVEEDEPVETRPFSWDWPFTEEGVARGEFNEQKFLVRLPFKCGTNNEGDGTIMKVDKISEFNYCWTIGLSTVLRNPYSGNPFWRIEIEIVRSLNTFILFVCREIWTGEKKSQSERRFKKLRRVYKLPPYYDVATLKTSCYMDSFLIEVFRRGNRHVHLRRASTYR
uniref:Uncharacterized protein n=1 Tax=Acrobeloides nanus TaxID=290746 RepID=A0A914DXL5_9BILA